MSNLVELQYEYFPDFTRNRPVYNGFIYVGEPDLDPEVPSNQKAVTLRGEGFEVVVAQPVRTSPGGVPTYNGSPAQILVDGNYSVKVLDAQSNQVYYIDNALNGVPATLTDGFFVKNFSELSDAVEDINLIDGDAINLSERSIGSGGGGIWDVVLASTVTPNTYNIVQCTGVPSLALVLRVGADGYFVNQWGAKKDGQDADATANREAIQACLDWCFSLDQVPATRFESGHYTIDRSLILRSKGGGETGGTFWDGNGNRLIGTGRNSCILRKPDGTGNHPNTGGAVHKYNAVVFISGLADTIGPYVKGAGRGVFGFNLIQEETTGTSWVITNDADSTVTDDTESGGITFNDLFVKNATSRGIRLNQSAFTILMNDVKFDCALLGFQASHFLLGRNTSLYLDKVHFLGVDTPLQMGGAYCKIGEIILEGCSGHLVDWIGGNLHITSYGEEHSSLTNDEIDSHVTYRNFSNDVTETSFVSSVTIDNMVIAGMEKVSSTIFRSGSDEGACRCELLTVSATETFTPVFGSSVTLVESYDGSTTRMGLSCNFTPTFAEIFSDTNKYASATNDYDVTVNGVEYKFPLNNQGAMAGITYAEKRKTSTNGSGSTIYTDMLNPNETADGLSVVGRLGYDQGDIIICSDPATTFVSHWVVRQDLATIPAGISSTDYTPVWIDLSGPTANRPASGRPLGLPYYDSTLKKPIWWDANSAVWRDAAGTSV